MGVPWNDIAKGRGYVSVGAMMRGMYPKFTLHQLSQRFGCSIDAVRRQLEKEGIQLRARGGALVQPKLDKISEDDFRNKSAKEIAQEHGVDVTSVYKHMKRKGIVPASVLKRRAILEANEAAVGEVVEDVNAAINDLLSKD